MSEHRTPYSDHDPEALIELVRESGLHLPNDLMLEFTLRGREMAPYLAAIATDRAEWAAADQTSWAALHATHLLIASEWGVDLDAEDRFIHLEDPPQPAILTAVKYALAYDFHESIAAWIPQALTTRGPGAWDLAEKIAGDRTLPLDERLVWLEAAGCGAARDRGAMDERLRTHRRIAADPAEPCHLRSFAAWHLLLFARPADRPLLKRLLAEGRKEGTPLPFNLAEFDRRAAAPEPDWLAIQRNYQTEISGDWLGPGVDRERLEAEDEAWGELYEHDKARGSEKLEALLGDFVESLALLHDDDSIGQYLNLAASMFSWNYASLWSPGHWDVGRTAMYLDDLHRGRLKNREGMRDLLPGGMLDVLDFLQKRSMTPALAVDSIRNWLRPRGRRIRERFGYERAPGKTE